MKRLITKGSILVITINLLIALGFYTENINSGYSVLASDGLNIIPMAQKFDNPELFKSDLFLNSLDNVKYYTPFFVQPLRFLAKFTNYDYLQALNVFGFISHVLFGILWFFLFFRFTNSFWVSLILSVIIRGLIWLPGLEIWGIANIWTVMPRTVYSALLPIPFLLISGVNNIRLIASAFVIGLIFNFHPITGLGGILLFLNFLLCYYFSFNQKVKVSYKIIPFILLAISLGMLPFVITYFTKTETNIDYDLKLYREAFLKRIPSSFESPLTFLKQWVHLKTLFFIVPLLTYYFISIKNKSEFKKAKILLVLTVLLVFLSSISIYIENAVNSLFNLNIRIAFQFIRLQKLAILPAYFAMAFLLVKLKNHKTLLSISFMVFVLLLSVSKVKILDKVPLFGDDIFRSILPNSLRIVKSTKPRFNDIDEMMEYILNNTDQDAVFLGPPIIRSAAKRSVVLDKKGASVIIEGNPKQFIQWYLESTEYESLKSEEEKLSFLKNQDVNYILTGKTLNKGVELIHQINRLKLYKIND